MPVTTVDITNTQTLKQGFEMLPQAQSYLRDLFFPTNTATDIFNTEDVLVDYRDGDAKVAPYVLKGGKGSQRAAFKTERFTPPRIAPKRTLTIDDLKKRGFGEAISSTMTPAEREAALALRDLTDLDKQTTRTEELMCATLLLNSKITMTHYATGEADTATEEVTLKFFEGESNPNAYTTAAKWNTEGADILGDLYTMAQALVQKGRPVTHAILGADASMAVLKDETIRKLLDTNNYRMGAVEAKQLPSGVISLGKISVHGIQLELVNVCGTYEADDGTITPYIPANACIVTAAGVGRTLYGCVTQMEPADKQFHSYAGRRVPKYVPDVENDTRTLTLTSCPLPAPNYMGGWISAIVA